MKKVFILRNAEIRESCIAYLQANAKLAALLEPPLVVKISEEKSTRSLEANALMWSRLTDIAQQVEWHGQHLSPDDWKHILSASLKKQRAVPGIDGGFVVLGLSTSKMSKQEFSDLLELIAAFGAEKNVKWTLDK